MSRIINRIKYTAPDEHGICESSGTLISTNGAKYKVRLDTISMEYEIINILTYRKYCDLKREITNLHVLKRKVRNHLAKLGVPLVAEVRDRDYGRCEKGHNKNPISATNNGEDVGAIPSDEDLPF